MWDNADTIFAERRRASVTAPFARRRLKFTLAARSDVAHRALHRAGQAWLTRRGKAAIPKPYKRQRPDLCKWLLTRRNEELKKYACADGTTFNLARTDAENEDKQKVGDENYAKAQGKPVKT